MQPCGTTLVTSCQPDSTFTPAIAPLCLICQPVVSLSLYEFVYLYDRHFVHHIVLCCAFTVV